MYSTVWPAGSLKNVTKVTKNEWLSIQIGVQKSGLYKLVKTFWLI